MTAHEVALSAGAAALAFFATQVDELFLLVLWFGRATLSPLDVVLGNAIGFLSVLALSAGGGAGLGAFVPERYVRLLGLIPVLFGVHKVVRRARKRCARARAAAHAAAAADTPDAPTLPLLEEEEGVKPPPDSSPLDLVDAPASPPVDATPPRSMLRGVVTCATRCLRPGILEVAAVTLGNGTEEVAAFLPLYATGGAVTIATITVVLCSLAVLWLCLAWLFVRCSPVAKLVESYGEAAEPYLMIGVGVYCLVGSVLIPV